MSETVNVLPLNDLKPHIESPACKCEPSVEIFENGNRLVVHNSWDGREFFEDESNIQPEGFGEVTYV